LNAAADGGKVRSGSHEIRYDDGGLFPPAVAFSSHPPVIFRIDPATSFVQVNGVAGEDSLEKRMAPGSALPPRRGSGRPLLPNEHT
jgi:hypothetical protein